MARLVDESNSNVSLLSRASSSLHTARFLGSRCADSWGWFNFYSYYLSFSCLYLDYHTGAGGYVVVNEKLPNYVVPDLTDFKVLFSNPCK